MVYGEDGGFRFRVGGRGRGPGEFGGQLWWADSYLGDSLVAWDRRGPTGPSVKVFGPDGAYARDVTIPQPERARPQGSGGFSSGAHGWFDDGDFLTSSVGVALPQPRPGPVRFRHLLLSADPAGMVWDTIGEFGLMEAFWTGTEQVGYRFGAPGLVRPIGDSVLLANSHAYEYRILDRTGATVLIVRRQTPSIPVESGHVDEAVETFVDYMSRQPGVSAQDLDRMKETIAATPTAPILPAYSNVLVDDAQRVWVENYRWPDPWSVPLNPRLSRWDIFSRDGNWLATLDVPARVLPLSIRGDRLYSVRIDELDVRHVEVYTIQSIG